jgi:hypothetical protein
VESHTVDGKTVKFNFLTDPVLSPIPTDTAGWTSMASSVATAVANGKSAICIYLDVDVGQQGLNWDFTKSAVQTASIDLAGGTSYITATCDNCYAKMGGALTYKTDCQIDITDPTKSTCTVNLFVGGGVAFDLTMSVKDLNFAGNQAPSTIYSGTKTQVFYDPQTTISVSLTPTLKAAFSGTAKSTGALTVKTSMNSQVNVGATCSLSGSAFSFDVGYAGDIELNEPTITSNLQMDTYDLTISVTPDLMWTIGAGEMVTAPYVSAFSSSDVAATGMAVVMDVPNPITFSWNFAKKSSSDITSTASATVGFLVNSLNTYLAVNYFYSGSTATKENNAPLYDYSKWADSYVGTTTIGAEYKWPLYTAPSGTKPTTVALGTAKSGKLSLTGGAAPAPAPAPAPTPTAPTKPAPTAPTKPAPTAPTKPAPTAPTAPTSSASKGDAKSGMSGGAVAGLVIGLLVAAALAYYVFTQYTAKAPEANAGLDVKVEVTPTTTA